jgi:hypothetical protein
MAIKYKYRYKKGCGGMTYMGQFKRTLSLCTQKQLKTIYDEGNAFVERYEADTEQ